MSSPVHFDSVTLGRRRGRRGNYLFPTVWHFLYVGYSLGLSCIVRDFRRLNWPNLGQHFSSKALCQDRPQNRRGQHEYNHDVQHLEVEQTLPCSGKSLSPCGPRTTPASSKPTTPGIRTRRASGGIPTIMASATANFASLGKAARFLRMICKRFIAPTHIRPQRACFVS